MGAFYEEKVSAREIVHDYMSRPAVYFKPPYDPAALDTKLVTVRVHDKFTALGDLKGTNFNYAEIQAVAPKAIFLLEEMGLEEIERNYVISLKHGLAYRVDNTLEYDNITQTVEVAKIDEAKTAGFPVPEDFN